MMNQPVLPDYTNCGLNVAASVLRHFGAETTQAGHPAVDALLAEKQYKNIVLMLFDGLGMATLADHLPGDSFLRARVARQMTAVFPPTTVAATTSIESGLAPCEHGWLGWSLYLPPVDRMVDVFLNKDTLTGKYIPGEPRAVEQVLPYQNIVQRLNATGRVRAQIVSKHGDTRVVSLNALFEKTLALCAAPGRQYIYTYYNEPDHTMHDRGVMAAGEIVADIDRRVEALCARLPEDTLMMLTADHGLTDTVPVYVDQYPELVNACLRRYHIESRAAGFFVKPEFRASFPDIVARTVGTEDFWLLTGKAAADRGLFGRGREHPLFRSMIGDYLLIATGNRSLYPTWDPHPMIGMHAGLTPREMYVPLVVGKW